MMAEYVTEIDPSEDISAAVLGGTIEQAQPATSGRKCGVCGEPGHTARTCPAGPISQVQRRLNRADARQVRADKAALQNWSDEDIAIIGACVATLLMVGTRMSEARMHIGPIRMESEEADAIAGGATRIVLRRVRVKGAMKGDVMDCIAIVTALTSYVMRIGELSFTNQTVRRNNEPVGYHPEQRADGGPASGNGVVVPPTYFTGGVQPRT